MHIPDGYLGPPTYITAWGAMIALWSNLARRLGKTLKDRQVPLVALGAAFSFVIMMFNIPVPGGSSGHAVGAVLIAVLIGPGAACIAVSTALIIQALFFGDGGITALGANCLNIAVVMPWTGYWTYRLVSRGAPASSRRVLVAAGVGGYVGLNASALTTALMFGLQPILHHTAQGRPIYCPYPLSIAVPAMAVEHLLIFGFAEAAVTALVIKYLQHADLAFLAGARGEAVTESKDSCGVSQPPVEEGAHA